MQISLTDYEAKVVFEVVYTHKGRPMSEVIACLRFIFEDIRPAHYIAVGLAIGEMMATDERCQQIKNLSLQ